jgi:predicted HTH domain antitoxin
VSKRVVLDIPDGVFSTLRAEPVELGRELRLAAAVKWYESGKLSQAKAAELAGLSRYDFINALSRFKVSPVQETSAELAESVSREQ